MNLKESTIILKPVSPSDNHVMILIDELNQYQIGLYGIEKCNLETPESLQKSNAYLIGAYSNGTLAGIGGIKLFDGYAEIKRMYVGEKYRGLSIAKKILDMLEAYAMQKEIYRICLETGNLHQSALKFYKKLGYTEIGSFGNYKPNEVSVYFEKVIQPIY